MSEEKSQPLSRFKHLISVWLLVPLAALLLAWFAHPAVLSWALEKALRTWWAGNRMSFAAEEISARLDGPIILRGAKIRALPGSGLATALDIPFFECRWGGIACLFSASEPLLRDVTARDISGIWDLEAQMSPLIGLPGVPLQRWLPRSVELGASWVDIVGRGQKWSLRDFELTLGENSTGRMGLRSLGAAFGGVSRSLGPLQARTAWKNGTLWLAGAELVPGIGIDNMSLDFLHAGGPEISLNAACFGGSLRCDLSVRSAGGTVDLAAWASRIPLDKIAVTLGIPGEIAGNLAEGRLTFRGRPDRPSDAEASLRLVAEGFRWNQRGWESLEVGASLIHRRLVVTGFDLRQKENRVHFNGEISLADGWSQIAQSPFLLDISADIREIGALAGLLGGPFDEAEGRMSATGSLAGRPGELDGFLNIEASGVSFRSLPPATLRMGSVFRKNEIEIEACDIFCRKDCVSLRGTVSLLPPHQYAADLNARIADLAVYLAPFHTPGAEKVYAGSLEGTWQGDGNAKSHSGYFDLKLKNFVSGVTPAGLTGKFAGTYSPQNLYFSALEFEHGTLKLDSRATVAGSGLTLKDVELRAGNTTLLEGSAFIPIDIFTALSGKNWIAALDPEREAYLLVSSPKDLSLRSLLLLAGQDAPVEGQVKLNISAGGPLARLSAKGLLAARDILWKLPGSPQVPASLSLSLSAQEGTASLSGLLEARQKPTLQISARMPLGLKQDPAGNWQWNNPADAFEGAVSFPGTDLAIFRPCLQWLPDLSGRITGNLSFSGLPGSPLFSGSIGLVDIGFGLAEDLPHVSNAAATLVFGGDSLQIEKGSGEMGGGPFEIAGTLGLRSPLAPEWDLRLHADKISALRQVRGVSLMVGADLALKGNASEGSVRGTLRFMDGRLSRLEVVPSLDVPASGAEPSGQIPAAAPFLPAGWVLDVKLESDAPLLIGGKVAPGEIFPDMALRGTAGSPVPVGRVVLKNVQAFFPAAVMDIPEGHIDFLQDFPWIPFLDLRGIARLPGYEVQAFAFGPAGEKNLVITSLPPLTQDAIVGLLVTGHTPVRPSFLEPEASLFPQGLPASAGQPNGDPLAFQPPQPAPPIFLEAAGDGKKIRFWGGDEDSLVGDAVVTYSWSLK